MNKNLPNLLIATFFLTAALLYTYYYFNDTQNYQIANQAPSTVRGDNNEISISETRDDENTKLYKNEEYGFSFTLGENEQPLVCINKNEYHDYISIRIVESTSPADPDLCHTGGSDSSFLAAKPTGSEYDIYNSYFGNLSDYEYTTMPYSISGYTGDRVTGTLKQGLIAPLPNKIDNVYIRANGILYEISADFLDRNPQIF